MNACVVRWLLPAALACLAFPAWAGKPLADAKNLDRLTRGVNAIRGMAQAQGQVHTPLERQRWAYGVISQPQLDAMLDQVLQELRRAAGPDAPPARVYVTPDPSFQAYATEDGSIFVAAGMLQSLESRDELAALLAHEYAHVLGKHTGRSALEKLRTLAAGATSAYLDYEYGSNAATASRPELEYVRHAVLREAAMQSVQSGIVPARARKQEDEADRVGTDLMVAAGFNPIGMLDLLDRIDGWERDQQGKQATAQSPAGQEGVAATTVRFLQNTDQARSARRKIDDDTGLVNDVTGALVGMLESGVRRGARGHHEAGQRSEQVMAHIEKKYAGVERPDMRPVPWQEERQVRALFASLGQMYQLLGNNDPNLVRAGKEQTAMLKSLSTAPAGQTPLGRYVALRFVEPGLDADKSMARLQQELGRPDSLFAAHQLVLDLVSRSGNREQALQVLEVSRGSLGDPPELLPYGVRLNQRAGKRDVASGYAARCAASGNDKLKQRCLEEL